MADAKGDKTGPAPTDLLSKFLGDLEQLPRIMIDGMLNQAGNEDEKVVIRALGGTLQNQFSELVGFIREQGGDRLSVQQRQESEQVLRLSAAGSLIASGSGLATSLGPQVAKIGLAGIVKEIKKIIPKLLEAFGIKIPKWLDVLLTVIDELLNLFLSTGSPSLAGTLSRMEQDYLAELTHLSRLQRENELRAERDNEENA
jgi:hypothetical protein